MICSPVAWVRSACPPDGVARHSPLDIFHDVVGKTIVLPFFKLDPHLGSPVSHSQSVLCHADSTEPDAQARCQTDGWRCGWGAQLAQSLR